MVFSDIIEDAAILFDCTPFDILSGKRTRKLSAARHAICLALRRRGNELVTVARWMRIDHTSVLYAEKKAAEVEAQDPVYALKIKHIVGMRHLGQRLSKPVKNPKLKEKQVTEKLMPLPDTGEKLDYAARVTQLRDIDRIAEQIEKAGGRVHWTLPSIQSVVFSATETLARHVGRIPEVTKVTPNAMMELGFA